MYLQREIEIKEIQLKPYRLKELAGIYGMSNYYIRLNLQAYKKKLGKRIGHYYNREQVAFIFSVIHLPSNCKLIDELTDNAKDEADI